MSKINKSYRDFYTYSLIKTLYLKWKSLLDTFSPFILNSLKNDTLGIKDLANEIKEKFWLNIPVLTLQDILKKLKKLWNVDFDDKYENIYLTEKWKKWFKNYLEDNREVFWELESLFKDISIYIEMKTSKKLDNHEIYQILENIINNNFAFFVQVFNPNKSLINELSWLKYENNEIKNLIAEFIIIELNNRTKNFEVVKKITYWALLSSVLTNDSLIDESNNYNFNNLIIYLDSNIILSLLWWHWDELKKSNTELIDLIKKRWIRIKVFNFTVDEIISVIEWYFNEKDKYIKWYFVDSIYQNFKNNWYNDSKIYKLIAEFENIINDKFWIEIDNKFDIKKLDFDINIYDIEELELKREHSKEHDIFAIEAIKKYRNWISPRNIELSKYIFLSYDRKLFLTDCKVNNKSLTDKIPHIIYPEYFSNYLWLKKPDWDNNLPIAMIFSSVHSHWLIDKDIWERFYQISSELSSDWKITKEDFMYLISNNEFKNQLVDIENKKDINKDLILKSVDETKLELENKTYEKLKVQFDENLLIKTNKNNKDYELKIINNIKEEAKKHAKILTNIVSLFIFLMFIFIITFIYKYYLEEYFTIKRNNYWWIITFILFILSIFLWLFKPPKFPKDKIYNFLFKKIVDKKINKYLK